MGKFVDTLISFNKSKRAKVFAWSFVSFGIMFLLLGIMFTLMNPSSTSPNQITLVTASQMPYETREGKTGYHLKVLDPTTSIITGIDISNKNIPIKFYTQQTNLIEVTPAVMPGQAATIKIKRDLEDHYYLSGEFTIQVSCGSFNTVIYGEIVLTQQKTEILATLQKETSNGWEETNSVRPDILDDTKYRVNVIFKAFGQVRCTTLDRITNFDFISIDEDYSDITELFGEIKHTLTNAVNYTYTFDLWVDFQGERYYSKAPFSITFTTAN